MHTSLLFPCCIDTCKSCKLMTPSSVDLPAKVCGKKGGDSSVGSQVHPKESCSNPATSGEKISFPNHVGWWFITCTDLANLFPSITSCVKLYPCKVFYKSVCTFNKNEEPDNMSVKSLKQSKLVLILASMCLLSTFSISICHIYDWCGPEKNVK